MVAEKKFPFSPTLLQPIYSCQILQEESVIKLPIKRVRRRSLLRKRGGLTYQFIDRIKKEFTIALLWMAEAAVAQNSIALYSKSRCTLLQLRYLIFKVMKIKSGSGLKRRKKRQRKNTRSLYSGRNAFKRAVKLHQKGQLVEAELLCSQMLRANADRPEVMHLLSLIRYQQTKFSEAVSLLRQAILLSHHSVGAINDLGNMLHEMGQLAEAAELFHKLTELNPDYADAYNNLGVVLKDQGKLAEAETAYHKAAELNPGSAGTYFNLGNIFKRQDKLELAATAYRAAISRDRLLINAYRNLVAVLRRDGKQDEALATTKQWLREDPDSMVARHMLSALSGRDTPPKAADEYVRQVFDEFAATFDEELQELGYRGPELMANSISKEFHAPEKSLNVLDAGCGTGLCGPYLQPYARTLVGVDLSPAMIDCAGNLEVYDELTTGELMHYLNNHTNTFDLIIAADTINYFGTLAPLFVAVKNALQSKGLFIFTLEKNTCKTLSTGYHLNPNGRYTHTENYLKYCLAEAGLTLHSISDEILRHEAGSPVYGMLIRTKNSCPSNKI